MLRSTSGSRLFIGVDEVARMLDDLNREVWVEIASLEHLGFLGIEWETQEVVEPSWDVDTPDTATVIKTVKRGRTMQIVAGLDEEDAGQQALVTAANSVDDFHFRLVFPGGASRTFTACVTSFSEQFDEAASVMKVVADLALQGEVDRS